MNRRDLLTGATMVAAGAVVPAIAQSASPDAALLAACHAFRRAHADQMALDEAERTDDAALEKVVDRWYGALQAVHDAPAPHTAAGRHALAETAWIALLDQAGNHAGPASPEELVALKALAAVGGAT